MEASSKYYKNEVCEFMPCHKGLGEEFNCLFCYCPLYQRTQCPGQYHYVEIQGKKVKSCEACNWPHDPANYETLMKLLSM